MFGEFPTKCPDRQVKYFYLDLERKIAEFAPGIEIPLAPFPGILGVARAEPGQYSSVPPGRYGGNLDIRDETEGSTLYVPVFVKGALLWTGDSHAAQGNGEINLTALETAYKEMNVTVEVLKGTKLEWPRIETKNSWITVGIDRDLNKALEILKTETTAFLMEQRKIGKDQGEKLEPPRCLRPCEHGDGLPARGTPWTAEGRPLSPAEEYVGGVPIRTGLFGLMLAAAVVAAAPAAALLRVVATTTDMAALAAA